MGFTFAIGATAGNRIQFMNKEDDNKDWIKLIQLFGDKSLPETLRLAADKTTEGTDDIFKHVKLVQAQTLPGTQEASYELQAIPRKTYGRPYRNFVSCGGASAQVGIGLCESTKSKFKDKESMLKFFSQCAQQQVEDPDKLTCGTEERIPDFINIEETENLGTTGLVSFLSGNQERANPNKPCKSKALPPFRTAPKFSESIASAKAALDLCGKNEKGEANAQCSDCSGFDKLYKDGFRLHLVGGMDQAYGADDKTTDADDNMGFGKWATTDDQEDGELKSQCAQCFKDKCKDNALKCKSCIKEYLKWDFQHLLTKAAAIEMTQTKKEEVDHHAYAVAQVFASWGRVKDKNKNLEWWDEANGQSTKYAGKKEIQARQFQYGKRSTVDMGEDACINNERDKYHGQWGLLFTFALAESLSFGTLEWEPDEGAEWVDGMAADNGFLAENVVDLRTPFMCEFQDPKKTKRRTWHRLHAHGIAKKRRVVSSIWMHANAPSLHPPQQLNREDCASAIARACELQALS